MRNIVMKIRGIVVIDYEIDGNFRDVVSEQERLEANISKFADENVSIVGHQVDMRERRGTTSDITKMKFRNN